MPRDAVVSREREGDGVRGLDEAERALCVTLSGGRPNRAPTLEEFSACRRLYARGCLQIVSCPCGCGAPSVQVSAHGREVLKLDKLARGETVL